MNAFLLPALTAGDMSMPANAMLQVPELDVSDVEKRLTELAEWVSDELEEEANNCCREWRELVKFASMLKGEEKLFYVFLATHFASVQTAKAFHAIVDWNTLLGSSGKTLYEPTSRFFHHRGEIGDHRRYFRCMNLEDKITFTVEVLEGYKAAIQAYGSQAQFFVTGGQPDFEIIYERMRAIRHFDGRLPRFDHLEGLARTHGFYIVPTRFFAADDKGGPRDGLTYLVLGLRLRRTKGLSKYLVTRFPDEWNATVDVKYRIPRGTDLADVLTALELWCIDQVRERLPKPQQKRPAYVFVLESCLCGFQKGM
jgi:hypothetical protein